MKRLSNSIHYQLMLLPGLALLFLFSIVPMFGIVIAFQHFIPVKGIWHSDWVGLDNFKFMFELPDSKQIFINTLSIAVMKIVANLLISLLFALLLNEVRRRTMKRLVQTAVYLPHFLSWVILAGIMVDMLSLDGIVNHAIRLLGFEPVFFMGSNRWFPFVAVFSEVWKEFGFSAIIFLAALSGINPSLYEAAEIDGAGRLQKIRHITLPGVSTTIVLLATLAIGNVLNAGFDQIFNLYNPMVYASGDIIDTWVYRTGMLSAQYGLATAVGLLKSIVGFVLIVISYGLAYRLTNYRIF
ncbi:ABC transporter permease [Cohnella hashimotonis]|uniref:ABC transporter permease subunit n=1 Tax=Cohnella hashimotonis TaxID=2826895 RepID=A0ABT6TA38_9BACL|nr:ABC transporter permease subunit [Cohnella hashimotonis]MDI4643697.1 ABC transporter permease subunit [Cohnella hashimotonis]